VCRCDNRPYSIRAASSTSGLRGPAPSGFTDQPALLGPLTAAVRVLFQSSWSGPRSALGHAAGAHAAGLPLRGLDLFCEFVFPLLTLPRRLRSEMRVGPGLRDHDAASPILARTRRLRQADLLSICHFVATFSLPSPVLGFPFLPFTVAHGGSSGRPRGPRRVSETGRRGFAGQGGQSRSAAAGAEHSSSSSEQVSPGLGVGRLVALLHFPWFFSFFSSPSPSLPLCGGPRWPRNFLKLVGQVAPARPPILHTPRSLLVSRRVSARQAQQFAVRSGGPRGSPRPSRQVACHRFSRHRAATRAVREQIRSMARRLSGRARSPNPGAAARPSLPGAGSFRPPDTLAPCLSLPVRYLGLANPPLISLLPLSLLLLFSPPCFLSPPWALSKSSHVPPRTSSARSASSRSMDGP